MPQAIVCQTNVSPCREEPRKELTLDNANGHASSGADEGGERLAVRGRDHAAPALGHVAGLERELEVGIIFQNVEAVGSPIVLVRGVVPRHGMDGKLTGQLVEAAGSPRCRPGPGPGPGLSSRSS